MTSAAVIRRRISNCIGTIIRLSTSNSRNSPGLRSDVGTIYESNSTSGKSGYSYLQYHWWPMVLTVTAGWAISSVKYRRRREGSAKNTRTMAGRIVHIVSTCWASVV